jgi:hypothetical protein
MIYQRGKGKICWYRFRFGGVIIHESARTESKSIAREAERQRRRELECKWNKLEKRALPPTFSTAATHWLDDRSMRLAPNTIETYSVSLNHLRRFFGSNLICDIDAPMIGRYQRSRNASGAAAATINKEVVCLASILNKFALWAPLRYDVKMLEEREVGIALSPEQEALLLARASRWETSVTTRVIGAQFIPWSNWR